MFLDCSNIKESSSKTAIERLHCCFSQLHPADLILVMYLILIVLFYMNEDTTKAHFWLVNVMVAWSQVPM